MSKFRPELLFGSYSQGTDTESDLEKWFLGMTTVLSVVLTVVAFITKSRGWNLAALCSMPTGLLVNFLFVREAPNRKTPWMHKVLILALPLYCALIAGIIICWRVLPITDFGWFVAVLGAALITEALLLAWLFSRYRPKVSGRVARS